MRAGDVHEDHLRRDDRAVARCVVRPGVLVGVVAQIDEELVVSDLERHAVDHPAVLLLVERERALRQVGERAQRNLLAVIHEHAQCGLERLEPVPIDELDDSSLAHPCGGDACPHVALQEVGEAAVRLHDLHHRANRLALGDELHGRQAQALLEDLLRLVRDRAGNHAADVVPVRDVRRPRHELSLNEHRHREHDVVEVRDAAVERVVRGENVARKDVVGVVHLHDPPHRLIEDADEGRDACT